MNAVGQEFWIVAAGCSKAAGACAEVEKDAFLAELKRNPALKMSEDGGPWKFNVPDGDRCLLFGSFDNLIRLMDDLQKFDAQVEGVVHRLERQYVEIDPRANFKVKSQRTEKQFIEYLRNWQWDEAKYPRSRSISDNLTLLMAAVNRLEEEARNKTAQYNDFKTQRGNMMREERATLWKKDLIDVLIPEVVKSGGTVDDDFIHTEHLTTLVVILNRGADEDFLKTYETMAKNVVPMSARKFQGLDDKDGSSMWRVIVFKSAAEAFKKACRERKYVIRDFEYSEDAYKKLKVQRASIDESVRRQHEVLKILYQAAWSDTFVAWMHLKAMRVFVESVLRFGMPPKFGSFIVLPKAISPARKALADILGKFAVADSANVLEASHEESDEYFPYVSFSFTPFTVSRDKA